MKSLPAILEVIGFGDGRVAVNLKIVVCMKALVIKEVSLDSMQRASRSTPRKERQSSQREDFTRQYPTAFPLQRVSSQNPRPVEEHTGWGEMYD